MKNIRPIEMRFLDDLFGMGGGYVLDFSNPTFTEFFEQEIAHGLAAQTAFRNRGEQIDGSFEFQGQTYLLETKWQNAQSGAGDLHTSKAKYLRRRVGHVDYSSATAASPKTAFMRSADRRASFAWTGWIYMKR
jgi:hypothetical protein